MKKSIKILSTISVIFAPLALAATQFSYAKLNDKKFEDAKPTFNNKFEVNSLWTKEIFGYKTEGSNSYRIPGIIKIANGDILINADKRIENTWDSGNTIEQVQKVSKDNGETWTYNQSIVKIATPKTNKGLIIDGTYLESNSQNSQKLTFLFNMFAERAGIGNLLKGNPWISVNNKPYLKVWLRSNGYSFDSDNYVFKELTEKPGWMQMYKIANKLKHNQVKSESQLIATNTYVDNSYNSETRAITGQVYENVGENELNDLQKLKTKATKHSIYDAYKNDTKYTLAKNNHNATLESYDNGKTWSNFQMIDKFLNKDGKRTAPFNGNAVGNGIQLKNQKNSKLNGRLIFPMYSYENSVQKAYYIYSDDNGRTWDNMFINGLQGNSTESTFTELEDGSLLWVQRQSYWGRANRQSVSKSIDGGITWFNPFDPKSKQIYKVIDVKADGNVFSGMTHFKLKGKDYFLFALPKGNYRHAGSVYITDGNFDKYTEVYSFDIKNKEHFGYSYPITVNVTEEYADILIAYEWSPKTRILKDTQFYRERPLGGGIQLDKLRIKVKNN